MKRWVFIILLLTVFSFGASAGILAAYALHQQAYQEGSMHRSAEIYVQVDEFKAALKSGRSFVNGGWEFQKVGRKKPIYLIKELN